MAAQIYQFPCRQDNFGVLIHDPASGATAAIDAPEEAAVRQALAVTGWKLTDILVTHRHGDHVEGITGLKRDFGCTVTAPAKAGAEVPKVDRFVAEGDTVMVGGISAKVMDTPGHCRDHVAFHFADDQVLFVGDTLFALGCGRVMESTFGEMFASLSRFSALPDATKVYFGHEYTLSNARFALSVDPANQALKARAASVEALRAKGEATSPTTIGVEKQTNPFLRAADKAIQAHLNMAGASPVAVFQELRERKNRF